MRDVAYGRVTLIGDLNISKDLSRARGTFAKQKAEAEDDQGAQLCDHPDAFVCTKSHKKSHPFAIRTYRKAPVNSKAFKPRALLYVNYYSSLFCEQKAANCIYFCAIFVFSRSVESNKSKGAVVELYQKILF